MKTYLCQSLIVLSLCSCSTESPDINIGSTELFASKPSYKNGAEITSPANPDNPYDYAGVLTEQILDEYASQPDEIRSLPEVTQIVEDLLNTYSDSDDSMPVNYEAPDLALINQLLLNADQDFLSDLTLAGYSGKGKLYLQVLKAELTSLKLANSTYEAVYSVLQETEAAILGENLSPGEEEALLITTSILRYSLYNDTKRKRRDRDWEWSTANIAATSTGSMVSVPDAVALCVISKVYEP